VSSQRAIVGLMAVGVTGSDDGVLVKVLGCGHVVHANCIIRSNFITCKHKDCSQPFSSRDVVRALTDHIESFFT
jgi:hypothetical protein